MKKHEEITTADIWEFVGKHYEGYHQCNEIYKSDILSRIVDEEYEEGDMDDSAWSMIIRDYDGDPKTPQIKIDLDLQNGYCYEKAIEGYLSEKSKHEEIEQAKEVLRQHGYADFFLSIHDVNYQFDCTDEEAKEVMETVSQDQYLGGEINEAITTAGDNLELDKQVGNIDEFELWLESDYVVKLDEDAYIEQVSQWKKRFTLKELKQFYIEEYEL